MIKLYKENPQKLLTLLRSGHNTIKVITSEFNYKIFLMKNRTLFTLFFLISLNVFGQKSNKDLFIEPCIHLAYDSTKFEVKGRYSNSFYGTESYDIKCLQNDAVIFVGTKLVLQTLSKAEIIEKNKSYIQATNNLNTDSLKIHKEGISLEYNNFIGNGFIFYSKKDNKYVTTLNFSSFNGNNVCGISYLSASDKPIESYEADLTIAKLLIDQLTYVTMEEKNKEDSLIQAGIEIIVEAIPRPTEISHPLMRMATYFGKVMVKTDLPVKLEYVSVKTKTRMGGQVFEEFDSENTVSIYSVDNKEVGEITRSCELLVLSAQGRKIRVPFEFTYVKE